MAKKSVTPGSSSEELANPDAVSAERMHTRWDDWRTRVEKLYADVEQAFQGTQFRVKRTGGTMSNEELPKRVGVELSGPPDVLHVVRPDNSDAATLIPRGLWVIGANGRVDLKISSYMGGTQVYMLIDESRPLSGPAKWTYMPIGAPFNREPFNASSFAAKLQ
jgi:hypothetical protein